MAVNFQVGIPYKKVKNNAGDAHTSRVPMLFKTLSTLIFRASGHTVEQDLAAVEARKRVEVYATATAYNTAYAGGQATDVVAIVLSDS